MEQLFFYMNIAGVVAFAISGAMTGIRKQMDILGVMILGMTTAVGGGIFRDIILGVTPPQAFQNPVYAISALFISALVFLIVYMHADSMTQSKTFQLVLNLADTVGLAVFSVVGTKAAFDAGFGDHLFLAVFLGTLTGVGGGLIRDMMAGDRPYIFVKHIYACASIAGALSCALLWGYVGQEISMFIGAAVVIIIRLLAMHFDWNLPHIELTETTGK